jgi:hypothetical protein
VVEGAILVGLQRMLHAGVAYVSRLLAQQKQFTYKPKDENILLDETSDSAAFVNAAHFVEEHYRAAVPCLEGKNLDKYLLVLAMRVHGAILAHLKKMQVSGIGAAVLAKDVKTIQESMKMLHLPAVDELFNNLLVLCNVFFVTPDNIHALLTTTREYKLNKISMQEVHDFLKMRADYNAHKATIIAQLPVSLHQDDADKT